MGSYRLRIYCTFICKIQTDKGNKLKKYLIFILPIFLYSANFSELIKSVDTNLLIKSKQQQTKALKKLLRAKKAKNYPSVDIHVKAVRLYDTPTTILHIPGFNSPLPVGTKTNLDAQLSITYPLFTGFAITKSIEKAKLKMLKSKLETKELKSELYLKIASIYSTIYSLNRAIDATIEAKTAIEKSYKKAKGLYDNGFINISNLYNIEAKKYEIISTIKGYEEQKNSLINNLSYITNIKTNANKLPKIKLLDDEKSLLQIALNQRADIKAIKIELKLDNNDIALIKSKDYPAIALFGAFKRQGDTLSLDGNGFTNADQSYIGASLSYNIFDGKERQSEREAAYAKRSARVLYFSDYKRAVKMDIQNALSKLESLKYQAKAAKKQTQASQSYYKLINGRFENSLASGDELSRSIANLAQAKAKEQNIRAKIFLQKCKISILAGSNYFLKLIYDFKI